MRVYNFSAGPSMLPVEVLEKAQAEMVEYGKSGMSVMEMSHRSKDYEEIIFGAEKLVRELMNVPDNYKVLFLQGGGSSQFTMVAQNLGTKNKNLRFVVDDDKCIYCVACMNICPSKSFIFEREFERVN